MCAIRDAVRADLLGGSKSAYVRASKWAGQVFERWARVVVGEADPNDRRLQGRLEEGLTAVPLSTSGGRRRGTRERLLAAMSENGLSVEYDALLATRVLLDGDNRAVGVEYLKGRNSSPGFAQPKRRGWRTEAGLRPPGGHYLHQAAFNTPQLLMLSGIGPAAELRSARNRECEPPSIGVGRNLQDRYEIGAVHRDTSARGNA